MNDAKAYIRSLAQLRQRNVAWAEEAVSKAASLTAKEALQENVINFMKTNNMIHHKRQKFQKMIQYPLYDKYNTIRIKQTIVI